MLYAESSISETFPLGMSPGIVDTEMAGDNHILLYFRRKTVWEGSS